MKGLLVAIIFALNILPIESLEPIPLDNQTEDIAIWQDCNAPKHIFSDEEVETLARLIYGEARNCRVEGQAAVVWCVLNRMDSDDPYFPDTVIDIVTQPSQFFGYCKDHPLVPELIEVVEDVLMRYNVEQAGIEDVGRVLPREYLYFSGDGTANYFTTTYAGNDVWNWSMYSPYSDNEGGAVGSDEDIFIVREIL